MHGRVGAALHLGWRETARLASGKFADGEEWGKGGMEYWSDGTMEEWEKTTWFKSQHSITPILHSLIYGKGTGIEIKGRRRCAGVFGGDQRRRKSFARRFQRQERRAVFLSEGRHAGLHEGSVRVPRPFRRVQEEGCGRVRRQHRPGKVAR